MSATVINNDGSGSIATDSVESYSYSEDVTSLEPSELSGGTGQVTFTAPAVSANKVGNTHPNSMLLINNLMTIEDEDRGSVQFRVKQLSSNDGLVSITGSTIESRLNVDRTAGPHGGTGRNLLSAIIYYCGLVNVIPDIDGDLETELQAIPVNFIGWVGNVWEHLKMLCAGVSLSTTDNIGLEMAFKDNNLTFRKAKQVEATYGDTLESQSISVDSYEAAQELKVFGYNTRYGTNLIVQDTSESVRLMGYNTENVSIADSMQVDAGETVTKRFTINASLESVNQPSCVSTINPFPYTGFTGQYVIVGTDNLPVSPLQWKNEGGNLTVALTENPNEIEITVTAPALDEIPLATGEGNGIAPYKIGIESSGDGEYPALYITGTGVFYEKREVTFLTGASNEFTSKTAATTIDNPFITRPSDLAIKGVAAAQKICGPKIQLNESTPLSLPFSDTPGQMRSVGHNRFRITNVGYNNSDTTISAEVSTSFADFNPIWTGKTFANFKSIALDPATYPSETLKFNEFTIIPLMESN